MIVADTNTIAYLLLPGTHTAAARAALQKDPDWTAPLLWRSEFRNVLATCVRQGRVSSDAAAALMDKAEELMRGREYQVSSRHVLDLAADSACSAYDCEFVALADALDFRLVTSDARVLKAFRGRAVALADFARS